MTAEKLNKKKNPKRNMHTSPWEGETISYENWELGVGEKERQKGKRW